jgi:hypothetical protein
MGIGTVLFAVTMLCVAVGELIALYNPKIRNKAGPDWMWRGGRFDPMRNIFFRADGSTRRYTRAVLTVLLIPIALGALFLLVVSLGGTS